MTLRVDAVVLKGADAEVVRYPADEIRLLAAGHGDVQIADYVSEDREGPPFHSHPWDEAQIVVQGHVEFRIGDQPWTAGTVQLLPAGVPHAIRVPSGTARIIQVSIGPPYDGFAREMAALMSAAAPVAELAAAAERHGVTLH